MSKPNLPTEAEKEDYSIAYDEMDQENIRLAKICKGLREQLAVAEAALVDVGRTCLCERFKTTGFDYSETHSVLGQPRMGARWLVPGELIANCLNKLQAMKNEQTPHGGR